MKTIIVKGLVAASVLGSLVLPMAANAGPYTNNINHRLVNQHARVRQGVKSGQLTKGERLRDASADARIRARELTDKSRDNGHLTKGEHLRLERSLNRNSAQIYRTKHNHRVQ